MTGAAWRHIAPALGIGDFEHPIARRGVNTSVRSGDEIAAPLPVAKVTPVLGGLVVRSAVPMPRLVWSWHRTD